MIIPTEQEFAQVLISIVQASNIKVQFKQDTDSVFSVLESVRHTDFNNNNNSCMEDIKYIVGELNSRFLSANYSTPQAKKRGQNSKQIEDSVQERRNAKKPKLMSYDDTLELSEENNESEIFSQPFQPYSPTDSDLDKCSFYRSESNSKNNSANNSSDEPDITSDYDIEIINRTSDNETDPRPNPSRSLDMSMDPGPISETPTRPLGMFLAPPIIRATASSYAQPWLTDSGAAISGTGTRGDIANMRRCNIPITPAFGEVTRPTTEGTINDSVLGQLGIRVLHVDNMNHKLLSVHQVCDGGSQHDHQLGVFTNEDCRFFPLEDCRDALKLLSTKKQTFQGLAQYGVYVYSPVANMNK